MEESISLPVEVIFNLLFFMWILDEAMHNTEHNPSQHWHKTLILAEGKRIEKKDFLNVFHFQTQSYSHRS